MDGPTSFRWHLWVVAVFAGVLAAVVSSHTPARAQYDAGISVRLDTPTFVEMLDFQNRQGDKQLMLLQNKPCDACPGLLLGAQVRASFLAAGTNVENKFPYLGRFPPDFEGNSATDARMLQANVAAIADFGTWFRFYAETLFSDVFTFPGAQQGSWQMRQAYVVMGNFDVSPWYAYAGKKTVSFGDMGTLSPFTQSAVWHYFAPLAEGIGGGYASNGFNVTAMAINGGRGIRVTDSEQKGTLNNFAVNAFYIKRFNENVEWMIGGGYLHGTIYNAEVAEHLDPDLVGPMNAAWDVNTLLRWRRFRFAGEYAATVESWPATDHPVQAYRLEAAYDFGHPVQPVRLSASWSEGIQGDSDTEYEYNRQLVLGLAYRWMPNATVSLEYVRSMGFAPLIDITTVSDKSVNQDSAVLGLTLVL